MNQELNKRMAGNQSGSSSSPPSPPPSIHHPPMHYLCSICLSILTEPVTLESRESFHDVCIQSYRQLYPEISDNKQQAENEFDELSPELHFEIEEWCVKYNRQKPRVVSPSKAHEAALKYGAQEPPSPPPPSPLLLGSSNLETILKKLRQTAASRQEALTALVEYTYPSNRADLCHKAVLETILPMLRTHSPSTTTAATTFLLNLSTDPSNRFKIVHNHPAVVANLFDVLSDRYGDTPNEARDKATETLANLAMEEQNRASMGSMGSMVHWLLDVWLGKRGTGDRRGREHAGIALLGLATSCEGTVKTLLDEEGSLRNIVEMAKNGEEGDSKVRKIAIELLMVLGGTERGREGLIKGNVMEEMVGMLRDGNMERWALSVMWALCVGGLSSEKFKIIAMEAGAENELSQGREVWGEEGKKMAEAMLVAIRKKQKILD